MIAGVRGTLVLLRVPSVVLSALAGGARLSHQCSVMWFGLHTGFLYARRFVVLRGFVYLFRVGWFVLFDMRVVKVLVIAVHSQWGW